MKISNLHDKMELKKGPWTREEDQKLLAYVQQHGHGNWRSLPEKAGLQRCGKSCRLRWTNYLRPDIKRGKFTSQEDKTIIRLHALLGNRWSAIASHVPKRTDNEIKNYWNTRLKKRLTRMGINPTTHKPTNDRKVCPESRQAANLSHLTQWETTRLEAEERLVRESKLLSQIQLLRKSTVLPPPPPKPRCLDVLKVWQATNQDSFFSRPISLDSPTSTLNFSCNTVFPTDDNTMKIDHVQISSGGDHVQLEEEKLENLFQPDHDNDEQIGDYGSNMYLDTAVEYYHDDYESYNMGFSMAGDLEDQKKDHHWNELMNLVTSSQIIQ